MSILNVNKINPVGGGSTITIAGIASVTSSISVASSVTANAFYGDGSNLTGITGTTINTNADNRVITGSGSANTLNGEANLTFDGDNLTITGSNHVTQILKAGGATSDLHIDFKDSSNNLEARIFCASDQGDLRFYTGGANERLRIDSSGNVTKPNNFHILVDMSQNYTVQNASTVNTNLVKWDRVVTSQSSTGASSYFNTSTHLFTAPVSGLYYFDVAVNCDFNVEGAWLVINGSRANYSVFKPNSANTSTGNVTYKLSANDTVGLKWYDNGNTNADFFSNALHTWWRIILLG